MGKKFEEPLKLLTFIREIIAQAQMTHKLRCCTGRRLNELVFQEHGTPVISFKYKNEIIRMNYKRLSFYSRIQRQSSTYSQISEVTEHQCSVKQSTETPLECLAIIPFIGEVSQLLGFLLFCVQDNLFLDTIRTRCRFGSSY